MFLRFNSRYSGGYAISDRFVGAKNSCMPTFQERPWGRNQLPSGAATWYILAASHRWPHRGSWIPQAGLRSRGCGAQTPHPVHSSQPHGPHAVPFSSSVAPNKLLPAASGGKRAAGKGQRRACLFMPAFARRAPQAPSAWRRGCWAEAVHRGAPGRSLKRPCGREGRRSWAGCLGSDASRVVRAICLLARQLSEA